MNSNNIVQLFINAANKYSNTIAFIEGNTQLSYKDLLEKVQISAISFSQKGIKKGDKVLVFVPMSIGLYVVVLSLLYMGAVPVFLDEWVSLKRLKACLQTVPCTAIIASRKILFMSWFIAPLRKLKKLAPSNLTGTRKMDLPVEINPENTALVTFTTGSTGTPKAANRTHQFLEAQHNALHPLLVNDFKVLLTLLPIVVLLNLCLGKTNVLPAKKLDIAKSATAYYLSSLIKINNVEMLVASPSITVAIAQSFINKSGNAVQQVITGGGPMLPDQAAVICKAFPQATCLVVYGSTEAEPISTIDMQQLAATTDEEFLQKGLPVGMIHKDAQVAIVPFTINVIPDLSVNDFGKIKLPLNVSGELLVSGPHVLQAYLNNETAQRQNKFLVHGKLWHRTGDEALINEQNNLYFLGRCTEVIIWKGDNIYPLVATWKLKQDIGIKEAALLLKNSELILVMESADAALKQNVETYLQNSSLKGATILFVKKIPKDKRHQTKIDYEKLRKL